MHVCNFNWKKQETIKYNYIFVVQKNIVLCYFLPYVAQLWSDFSRTSPPELSDVWPKDQVSGCFVSHLPSRIQNVNPLWNVSASDARRQASAYVCAHDSVVFYFVS